MGEAEAIARIVRLFVLILAFIAGVLAFKSAEKKKTKKIKNKNDKIEKEKHIDDTTNFLIIGIIIAVIIGIMAAFLL